MRAIVVHQAGQPPELRDHPTPDHRPGRSLVQVTAATITPLDLLCASGSSYFGTPATPYVPGVQGVGVVHSSDTVAPGSRVWFATSAGMAAGDGSMAELASIADDDLVPLPDGVEDTQAAALGLSAVAAWCALTLAADVRAGENVLVLGAGGVVGQVAVQAARLLGVRRVVGAARSAGAQFRARDAGADAVVALPDGADPSDSAAVNALAAALDAACDGPVDVVVDPLCGLPATAAARLLGAGGRLVNLGSSAGPQAMWDSASLRSRGARIVGYTNNQLTVDERHAALQAVLGHAAAGRIGVAHEVVALADAAGAWGRQAAGTAERRLVVRVGG